MTGGFAEGLTDDDRAALAGRGKRRHYPRGAALFHEGDDSDFVVVLSKDGSRWSCTVTTAPRRCSACGARARSSVSSPGSTTRPAWRPRSHSTRWSRRCSRRPSSASSSSATHGGGRVAPGRGRAATRGRRRRAEFGALDATRRLAQLLAELAADGDHEGNGGAAVAARARRDDRSVAGVGDPRR